jgi:hypothetical protein
MDVYPQEESNKMDSSLRFLILSTIVFQSVGMLIDLISFQLDASFFMELVSAIIYRFLMIFGAVKMLHRGWEGIIFYLLGKSIKILTLAILTFVYAEEKFIKTLEFMANFNLDTTMLESSSSSGDFITSVVLILFYPILFFVFRKKFPKETND